MYESTHGFARPMWPLVYTGVAVLSHFDHSGLPTGFELSRNRGETPYGASPTLTTFVAVLYSVLVLAVRLKASLSVLA